MTANQTVEVNIRKTPLGAYVLMIKYLEANEGIQKYLDINYSPVLSKLAREPNIIYGHSQEGGARFVWMSWFFDSKEMLRAVLRHMRYVPVTSCSIPFKFVVKSFTTDVPEN